MTEIITGVNLPAAQLQIAMGIPLQNIADIRKRFGQEVTPRGRGRVLLQPQPRLRVTA